MRAKREATDTADPPLFVRYISWVAARGRNKVDAFRPYLSAIKVFFTDNFKEPPALGPFANHAMRVGIGVVLNYIVPCILDSAGARYFFGFLAPQRSAVDLSP
eukprot:jgi/Tetstr1/455451/TSEL_042280.t1